MIVSDSSFIFYIKPEKISTFLDHTQCDSMIKHDVINVIW